MDTRAPASLLDPDADELRELRTRAARRIAHGCIVCRDRPACAMAAPGESCEHLRSSRPMTSRHRYGFPT